MEAEDIKLVTEIEQRAKSNTRRIDRLEERLDKLDLLSVTVAAMQVELKSVLTTVQEIKGAVSEMQKKPGKWWDKLWLAVLTAVVGYVVTVVIKGGGGV